MVSFILFFGFSCFAQTNAQTKVGCDCLHKAGTVTVEEGSEQSKKDTASTKCADRIANIHGEEDTGLHIDLLSNNSTENNRSDYACFAIHYVYGFGTDRSSAINNARQTCALLVRDPQIEETIINPEECKNTR